MPLARTALHGIIFIDILTSFACSGSDPHPAVAAAVMVHVEGQHVVMDNGIVQLTLSKPRGSITGVKHHGVGNLLEVKNREDGRGYWDVVWNRSDPDSGIFDIVHGTEFEVVHHGIPHGREYSATTPTAATDLAPWSQLGACTWYDLEVMQRARQRRAVITVPPDIVQDCAARGTIWVDPRHPEHTDRSLGALTAINNLLIASPLR
ncbi:unnamed protein product [Musa acuminata subsp. burmannicoides]